MRRTRPTGALDRRQTVPDASRACRAANHQDHGALGTRAVKGVVATRGMVASPRKCVQGMVSRCSPEMLFRIGPTERRTMRRVLATPAPARDRSRVAPRITSWRGVRESVGRADVQQHGPHSCLLNQRLRQEFELLRSPQTNRAFESERRRWRGYISSGTKHCEQCLLQPMRMQSATIFPLRATPSERQGRAAMRVRCEARLLALWRPR